MTYIIAYTLKHKEIPDTFVDRWMAFREEDGNSEEDVKFIYDILVNKDGNEKDYYLYIIAMTKVIQSTDYSQ